MQVMTGFNLQKHVKSVTLTITVFMVCGEFEKMLSCYHVIALPLTKNEDS